MLRRTLAEVLGGTALPDPRTATLVGLLLAVGRVHKVVPHVGQTAREVKQRARQVAAVDGIGRTAGDAVAVVLKATAAAVSEADSGG